MITLRAQLAGFSSLNFDNTATYLPKSTTVLVAMPRCIVSNADILSADLVRAEIVKKLIGAGGKAAQGKPVCSDLLARYLRIFFKGSCPVKYLSSMTLIELAGVAIAGQKHASFNVLCSQALRNVTSVLLQPLDVGYRVRFPVCLVIWKTGGSFSNSGLKTRSESGFS